MSFDLEPEEYRFLCEKFPKRGAKAKVLRYLVHLLKLGVIKVPELELS